MSLPIPPDEHTEVPFTNERIDTDGMHEPVNAPELIIAPIAGLYLVECGVSLDPSPGATVVDIVIRKRVEGQDDAASWVRVPAVSGKETIASNVALLDVDAGQAILLTVQQDGLGTVGLYGAGCTMTWNGSLPPEE